MARCCREAKFSRASSRRDLRLDLAVASRAQSKSIVRVSELDPKHENVNDCALDGVLRRNRCRTNQRQMTRDDARSA